MPVDRQKLALGGIRSVTHVVPDLAIIIDAYCGVLEYEIVNRGYVSQHRADFWGAPGAGLKSYVSLAPASGEAVFLHFIEDSRRAPWKALTTHGWNATEIIVENVDILAQRIESSPFRRIGGPRPLTNYPKISAMQVIGPAGECVYLTHAPDGCGMVLGPAKSFVGRVFSVVAGGPDIGDMNAAYSESFTNFVRPPKPTPIGIINEANGLPANHKTDLGLVELQWGTVLELDGYADAMKARDYAPTDLPPGMAMVCLDAFVPDASYDPQSRKPKPLSEPPDDSVRIWRGAADERIELLTA